MHKSLSSTILAIGVLAGCSSAPKYACPLPEGGSRCAGVNESYAAAVRNRDPASAGHESVLSSLVAEKDRPEFLEEVGPGSRGGWSMEGFVNGLFGRPRDSAAYPQQSSMQDSYNQSTSPAYADYGSARGGYPMPPDQGMPIYRPPQVQRAWTGPHVGSDGQVMHGGEYQYYTTPGQWNYGTLATPGAGAGVTDFEPAQMDRLIKPKGTAPRRSKPQTLTAGTMSSNAVVEPVPGAKK